MGICSGGPGLPSSPSGTGNSSVRMSLILHLAIKVADIIGPLEAMGLLILLAKAAADSREYPGEAHHHLQAVPPALPEEEAELTHLEAIPASPRL